MDDNDKLLLAKIEDLFKLCDKYSQARFSCFLNEAETEVVKQYVSQAHFGYNTAFFGGYDGAERNIFGVFPKWDECDKGKYPIAALRAQKGYDRSLSHRDYLGCVLSLGIDRSKIGDILVDDKGAYIFAAEDIADFVCLNIKKIANCGVKIKRVLINEEDLPKREYEQIMTVSASLRLDAVLAAALRISRRESSAYIAGGRVSVNHRQIFENSFEIKPGDLISVRGSGRLILKEIGTGTKSGKIHITLLKCVK